MKYALLLTLTVALFLFCACSMFEASKPAPPAEMPDKVLSVPVGKNWQLIEEAPALTDERNRPPSFQTEQSLRPEGARPVSPPDKIKIETPN